MKKLVALLLVLVMVVGMFAACDTNKPVETKPQETQGNNKPAETKPQETEKAFSHPVTTDPITITVLTTRHSQATNGPKDSYWFPWLEHWLHEEYGYNVTFDVQQTMETAEQVSLLLGTDSLPDIIWGIPLTTSQAVVYGDGEGMILDMKPYLNETYMPNAYAALSDPTNATSLLAATTPSGAIYGLPILSSKSYWTAGSRLNSSADRMFFYKPLLDELGLDLPKNIDEFYAICEAIKGRKTADGQDMIPILCSSDYGSYMEKTWWTLLGFYGSQQSKYGTEFAIKNGQVELPVYTKEYTKFIEVMNHLYTNGYLSQDYLTMDKDVMRGMTKAGLSGIASDSVMQNLNDWGNWVNMQWFPLIEGDELHISSGSAPKVMYNWFSSETKYPEICALIQDYLYTVEGCAMYQYGPHQDDEILNDMVDGWYRNEKGDMTTKLVDDGTYDSYTAYCYQYVYPYTDVPRNSAILDTPEGLAHLKVENPYKEYQVLDTVTGEYYTAYEKKVYTHDNAQGHWFLENGDASEPYITFVNLPSVYLSEEDALYAAELKTLLENHITSESAKFITGIRPLSEIPAFQEELKGMGIEDYIAMYREAYASFMEGIYG